MDQLPQLRDRTTLGDWRRLHPSDAVTLYAPRVTEQSNEDWCVRASAQLTAAPGRTLTRTAYFYLPPPPEPLELPSAAPPVQLVDQCVLGFVWTEIDASDLTQAHVLGEDTRRKLAAVLGTGEPDAKLHWWGAGGWRDVTLWRDGPLSVAIATTDGLAWSDRRGRTDRPRLLALASGPGSSIDLQAFGSAYLDRSRARHRLAASRVDEALRLSAVGGAERRLRSFLAIFAANPTAPKRLPASQQMDFVNAIDRWLTAAQLLPPGRRSAALLAADLLLQESAGSLGWQVPSGRALRQRFEARGARFFFLPIGGVFAYTHTWLRQALSLAPEGASREMAFLTLMEKGFETSGACRDQGTEGFRVVIAEGEAYLDRRPGSAIRADVHFLVAHAYSDIVVLAAGGGYDGSESEKYRADASAARERAIDHYRRGFVLAGGSARAREAWPDAWRVIAGLAPTRTRFYCIYD